MEQIKLSDIRLAVRNSLNHYKIKVKDSQTQVSNFIEVYSYIVLSTTCFGSSYETSSGWLLFLSKVKYTISNALFIVTYDISYNMHKNLK
jgi:hypothetical protein